MDESTAFTRMRERNSTVAVRTQDWLEVEFTNSDSECEKCGLFVPDHQSHCPVGKLQDFLAENWEALS